MGKFEHKPGTATVFKETDPSRPSAYTGSGKLPDGTDVWVNLYHATDKTTGELKRDKDGNPFYNVGIKPKVQQQSYGSGQGRTPPQTKESFYSDDLEDSIPF